MGTGKYVMLGVTLQWTSIPSMGEKPEITAGLMGLLAHNIDFTFFLLYETKTTISQRLTAKFKWQKRKMTFCDGDKMQQNYYNNY